MTILNQISNLQKAALGRNESFFNPADSGSIRRQKSKFNPRESISKKNTFEFKPIKNSHCKAQIQI
jgi:hypothetical protein